MNLLGIDVGSSSVKCAMVRDGRIRGHIARCAFKTCHAGDRVEIDADQIIAAVRKGIAQIPARNIDAVALSVMSPSWVAMDKRGDALTPVITHQDRRSVAEAHELER